MTAIYYPPTKNALQKSLDVQLDLGSTTSMTLNNVTGVQNKPGIVVIDRIDSTGALNSTSDWEWVSFTGTSGNTLTGLTRALGGSSDQDHAVGAIVEFVPDVTWGQMIADAFATLLSTSDISAVNTTNVVTPTGTQTLTNKTLTSPKVGTAINDTNGNELLKVTATASAVNELTLINGATGNSAQLNATGEANTGLDMKMNGTGKFRKPTIVGVMAVAPATSTATGDGKAFFRVPAELNGMNLTGVAMSVYTAGTTNTTDVQLRNVTDSVDMLTTKLTVDSGEVDSSTATAAVIDTTHDDVATADIIAIDIDAVSSTAAKGLYVEMRFELP